MFLSAQNFHLITHLDFGGSKIRGHRNFSLKKINIESEEGMNINVTIVILQNFINGQNID